MHARCAKSLTERENQNVKLLNVKLTVIVTKMSHTQCKFGQIQMMDSLNGYYCKKSKIPLRYYKTCY